MKENTNEKKNYNFENKEHIGTLCKKFIMKVKKSFLIAVKKRDSISSQRHYFFLSV